MENINVTVLGETISVPKGIVIQEIADKYRDRFVSPIMIAKIGTTMKELRCTLNSDTDNLQLFDITNIDGMRVYQRSVCFLLVAAAAHVLGKEKQVVINHSIKKNLYFEIADYRLTDEELIKIEAGMRDLVERNLPFEKNAYHIEKAIDMANERGYTDKAELFKYRSSSTVNIYTLGDVNDYFYGYMASTTGDLKLFKLQREADGFVLVFPTQSNPDIVEYSPVENISEVFREYAHIGRVLNINTTGDLNGHITQGKLGDIIRLSEALHEKKIAQIADMIMEKGDVKLVLVAGPSSSGKTTFAHRLSLQLRINGITPHTISLDDYFRNREEAPLDEFGQPNFEALEFVNTQLLNENLVKLLNGEEIFKPAYTFATGKSEISDKTMRLGKNEIIIAEGIHALNESLTELIPRDKKFKVFISALTSLNVDNHNRISTSDSRLIRRLVRDNMSRGASPARTMGMWSSVQKGEAEYIFPTQKEADTVFNSSLMYELAVLKQFAEPLLFSIPKDSPLYPECKRLIKFLSCFLGAPTEDIPKTSIIREFIGGSCFPV